MRPCLLGLALLVPLAGCATARPRPARAAGSLVFVCDPADARVTLDENDLGPCALWSSHAVGLAAGPHRLVVSREGYLPMESEVTPDGRRVTVRAVLRRVPE